MKSISIMIGSFIIWSLAVCAQAVVAEELIQRTFEIDNIHKVEASGGGELEIRIGAVESLVVIAPVSVMDKLRIEAKSSTLILDQKGNTSWRWFSRGDNESQRVKYKLTLTNLVAISANGSVHAQVLGPVKAESFKVHLTGSSSLSLDALTLTQALKVHFSGSSHLNLLDLTASKIEVHGSGASNMELAGQVVQQEVRISGASKYLARSLKSKKADVHSSGASYMELWVEESLDCSQSGASNLKYYGNPITKVKNSGASSVARLGGAPEIKHKSL